MNEELKPTGTEARVCQDIAARQAKGIAKYGTTVEDNPLGLLQWLQHAYEESLDLPIYLKRAIEQLQGVAPDAQPKAHIKLPAVELPASMRCGDAINVPPLTVEKPWYPYRESGVWIEVPADIKSIPDGLDPMQEIEVLTNHGRAHKQNYLPQGKAGRMNWNWPVNDYKRTVAYRAIS